MESLLYRNPEAMKSGCRMEPLLGRTRHLLLALVRVLGLFRLLAIGMFIDFGALAGPADFCELWERLVKWGFVLET